jgi:hypothetical protein
LTAGVFQRRVEWQNMMKFLNGEQSLRLDMADRLVTHLLVVFFRKEKMERKQWKIKNDVGTSFLSHLER